MSATNRGTERRDADYYPTPPPPIRALVRWLRARPEMEPALVVDPFAGNGALVRVVRDAGLRVGAMELRAECRADLEAVVPGGPVIGDALEGAAGDALRRRLLCVPHAAGWTNPPFSRARQCITTWAPVFTWSAWLLRLAFYSSESRGAWLRGPDRPAYVLALDKRVQFVAVCKGLSRTKTRKRQKGCGRTYELGTRGTCVCGGVIQDGSDATEYAWFVFWGRGRRASSTVLDLLEV